MKKKPTTERSDRANAFLTEPETGEGAAPDDLAEYLGENFLESATGGDDGDEVLHEDMAIDEVGGPFIETDAGSEFSRSDDSAAAYEPGEPEAFPMALRSAGSTRSSEHVPMPKPPARKGNGYGAPSGKARSNLRAARPGTALARGGLP